MNPRLPAILLIAFFCFSFSFTTSCAQTNTLNGVYAGIEVSLPTVMGQGMDRTDRVILFRPDGTFNHSMRKADWKTAVTGRYTMAGNKVTLLFNGGSKEYMELEKDGDLKASGGLGSYDMLRMATFNSVPPGFYKFSNVSSTGGGASGQVFTGSSANVGLYFDGKGGFSRQSSSSTMVAGNNVGGGVSNKDNGKGSYTIKDGVLHLNYADGKTETHSFFCRPSEKPLMAAINGRIYFMEDAQPANTKAPATTTKSTTTTASKFVNDARSTLYKANKVQGGAALDRLTTIKASGIVNGMTVVSKADLVKERIRIEWWKGAQLAGIEQLDGAQGWQWQNGKKTAMTAARVVEMKNGLYSGVLGLRRQVIDLMKEPDVKEGAANTVSIKVQLNGQERVYLINEQGQLVGDGARTSASVYSNLKLVDGILLPFTEKLNVNGQVVQIQYSGYEINPVFGEADWDVPK